MKYRTKVTLLVIALTIFTAGSLTAISYFVSRGLLVSQIQSQVLSIAATAASQIDGDLHQQIRTRADEEKAPYKTLEKQLRKVRDANRRDDISIKYVYTMIESDVAKTGTTFVVDAEESDTGDKSHVGDIYEPESDDLQRLDVGSYQIDPVITDEFGTWVSANAPIRDSQGKAVGAVGVDLSIDQMLSKTNTLLARSVTTSAVALIIAIGISFYLSKHVARPVEVLSRAVEQIGQGHLDTRVDLPNRDEFAQLGQAVNQMAAALGKNKTLRGALSRYLSFQVAEDIIRSGNMPTLQGERKKVSVLFLDIRGFVSMTNSMTPEVIVGLLNEFLDHMVEVVFRHQGTLDKFLGDGLMVLFGAPIDDAQHEYHAVCAAIDMCQEAKKLDEQWKSRGLKGLHIGIGINTGIAVVGNIGSVQRMDYTAIGKTVNLASRLESATKTFKHDILISETTYQAVKDQFSTVRVEGFQTDKGEPTMVVYAIQIQGHHHTNTNRVES